MKNVKFMGIVMVAIFVAIPVFARKQINLKGDWNNVTKSLKSELPIHAWVEDDNGHVSLFFEGDLGDVHVTVSDLSGTILYNQIVHANAFSLVTISVKNMVGECTLSITDGKNLVLGEFSL